MATFRSILSRWIFLSAVFFGSLISLGAVFAPLSPSFQGPFDPMRFGSSVETRVVSGLAEAMSPSLRDPALGRLEELVLTHRAISTSA